MRAKLRPGLTEYVEDPAKIESKVWTRSVRLEESDQRMWNAGVSILR